MRFFKGFVVFSLAMAVFSVTGCDLFTAGLGAKVDLAPPVAKIISPAPNTYVNADSFTVTGTASDDSGSPNLTVRVKNASGAVVQTLNVSPDSAGNWSITFKTRKAADQTNTLADGQYTIDVTAADAKGKTQNTYTSVIIDTLPPTVLVTSPLSYSGSQYTDTIDVKGEVYDATTIKDVKVSLLKNDGTVLAGPAVADGTNTWTIRFTLKGNASLTLLDGATYSYNVQVVDAAGNTNTYYFHRVDILNLKTDPDAPFPSMDEIGKIDQLGITGSTSGITPAALITKRLSNISQFGNFIYEADPQIQFQFTNIKETEIAENNVLPPKSKVNGIITPPVNSGAIDPNDPNSVKVEIFDFNTDALISTIKNTNPSGDDDHITVLKIGDSVSFSFALVDNTGLDLPPAKYKLKVSAKSDQNIQGSTNMLELMIDAEAPYFEETNIDANNMFRNGSFTMSFDGSHSTNLAKIEIYEAKGNNPFPATPNETITAGLPALSFTGKQSGNLPYDSSPTDGLYKYQAVLTTVGGKTATILRSVYYDTTAPSVEITSFDKLLTGNKVNKTVNFNAIAGDTYGVEGVKYFVSTDGGTAPAYAATVGGPVVQVLAGQSIDTTTLTDLDTYYLWVVAKDKAGNEGHSAAQQFVVDQSTDIPVVTFSSIDTGITAESQVIGPPVKNLLVSGGKISGTIEDDDGLPASATLYIDVNKDGDFGDAGETKNLTLSGSGLTKTFDYSVGALADGTYRFYIDVADTTGVHNNAMTPIWFAYDTAVPTVTFNPNATDSNPVGPYRNADFTVQGTVQDANGIASVEFSFDNGSTWEDLATTAIPGENKTWTRAIVATSNNGAKTLLVRTTDTFGRTNMAGPVTVTIDTGLPSGSINPFGVGYYADTLLALSGTASDTLSGVAKVEYSLTSSTGPWTQLTGTTNWFKNDIPASALPEGTGTVWVKVTDNAGNESAVVSRTFTVDHYAPVITVDASFDGAVYKNAQFTIFGTVADTNLSTSPIVVTAKKDGAAHTLTGTFTYAAGNWSQDVNIAGSGSYEITITATDAVGRQSVEKRTIVVDTTAPSLEITSVLPQLSGGIVNGKITLSVNASDANGLDGVKYFFRNDASIPNYTDSLSSPISALMNAPYSVLIDTTNAAFTDNSNYTLWVVARDRAGNVSRASTTITIQQSSDIPAGTIDSPANTEQIGADRKVRGTFQDDDGVAVNGAVLYVRKQGAGGYTSKPIALSSSAGQLVAWTVDITDVLTAGGDGTYEMYLGVTDDATRKSGLSAQTLTTAVQTFLYDVNPPTVSALTPSPSKPAYKAGDSITFSWTASDAGSGLASQVADIDGSTTGLGSITNPSGNNFQVIYTVPSSGISSGNKTITLVTTDGVGRTATRTYTFLIDVDSPVVDPAFTLDPGFVGSTPNGTFLVKGTAADNRGLDRVEINFSGPSASDGTNWWIATLSNGNWSYSVNSATYVNTSGILTIKVRAVDQAGNVSSEQTFTQSVDQAADKPVVTIISPVNGSTYGTTVQLSGTAMDDDNLAGVNPIATDAIEIDWKPQSGSYTTVNPTITGTGRNATWNYELSGLASGTYVVRARARDVNGTWGDYTGEITFTVNAGAPNLTVSTSLPAFTNNASLTLNGTASDPQGVQYVRVRINGGSWQNASAIGGTNWMDTSVTWQININLGSDGFKTLEIQAADGDSYATNQQMSTTLDTTPPAGAFDAQFRDHPTGSFLSTTALNKIVRITGTVTETNLADTDPVEISINGGAYTPVTGTLSWYYVWDTSSLSDGDYELRLRITDKAGNVTTSVTKTVTTNQSADIPQITQAFVSAPTPADAGNNVLSTLLKVSGTITDDDGYNTGAVSLYLDGSATPINATNTAGTTATWEYTWGSLTQGIHYYTITATDKNGAIGSLGPTYFLVDNANPTLTVSTPSAGAKVKAGTLVLSGSANDAGGLGTNALTITLRHSNTGSPLHNATYNPAITAGSFSQNITIDTSSLDGTLYIDFVLTDLAGRQSTLTRAVTIDTTPPVLNLSNPAPGAYINGLVSITGTADDLNGLTDVTMEILDPANLNLVKATINRSGSTLSSWEFPFNSASYTSATYAQDVSGGQGKLWKIWFKLKAVDSAGNVTELTVPPYGPLDYPYYIIDVDGDRPQISMTQPKNGDIIGGLVTMFGSAVDDDGPVMQVEAQIDVNGDGDFSDSLDLDNDSTIQTGINQNYFGNIVKIGDPNHKWEDETSWYVINATNNSWTQELNALGELYSTNTGGNGNIIIRVRARDMFGTPSEYIQRTITLDETFPRIENVSPNDQSYQHGIFTQSAEFRDNINLNLSSISQVKININKTGYITLTEGPNSGSGHPYALTANGTGFDLNYPIDTTAYFPGSSGILYVDLYVKDESGYTNQRSYTYYIDNQQPAASWSDRAGAPDGNGIRNGQINLNGTTPVSFIEGNLSDSGAVSGISHVEVYFVKAGTVRRIAGVSGQLTPSTTESALVDTYNEGTGTWSASSETVPFVSWSDSGYGNDYVIKIDRPTEMSSISTGADADGDGYYEFIGIDGGAQRFRAYFDSQYLPDGQVDIHYVVYDMAGNRIHKVRRGFIANSGPAISRIRIGSDYNNNGTIADVSGSVTEILDYYYPANSIHRYASNQPIKIKNGKLYFNVQSSDPNGTVASTVINIVAPSPGSRGLLTSFGGASGGNVETNPLSPIAITIGSAQFPTAGDYTLEVVVKDNDNIPTKQTMVIRVLDTADTTKPVITPTTLTQANGIPVSGSVKQGHLELQADNTVASWNTIKAAYGNDDDPKVSGEIYLRGTITDNNRIDSLDITGDGLGINTVIANWDGTQLVSADARLTIESQALTEDGHTVTFRYRWNTAVVTGVAGLNKTIAFRATDGSTNNSDPHSTLKFDVVPYITAITNTTGGLTTDVLRGSTGKYSLDYHATNTITVSGFNLAGASARISPAPINTPSGTALTVNSSTNTTAVIPRNFNRSGWLTLFVNSLATVNNLNDNTVQSGGVFYNKEEDITKVYTEQWNDDRYIWMWAATQVLPAVSNSTFYYPDMLVTAGGQPIFSYCNDNDGFTYRTTSDTATSQRAGLWYERQTALAQGTGSYWILSVEDAFSGGSIGFLQLNRDGNANASVGTPGNNFIEIIGEDYNSRQLNRFLYPKLIVEGPDTAADVYITYYDSHPSERGLTFIAMRSTGANAANFTQPTGDANRGTPVMVIPGTQGGNSSQYYDMVKVNSTDIAVVYYDQTAENLKLAYSSNAWDTNNLTNTGATWTTITLDSSALAGQHVSATTDGTYIYVAYYDNASADLKLLRVTWADKSVSGPYVIDSYLYVGTWTQIQVFNGVPYITYYSDSYNGTKKPIRMAFPTDGLGNVSAGNILTHGVLSNGLSEKPSGTWEVITIPAITVPKGGMEQFNHTQLGTYTNNGLTLPVVGWLADRIEYAKLQPNN
ncbi:MAG: Ig-like domain-containing protein [Spirochaetota bacterium]